MFQVAVTCEDDEMGYRGLLTSTETKELTKANWKCKDTLTADELLDDAWTTVAAESLDATWTAPEENGMNYAIAPWGQIRDIINKSTWMWTGPRTSSSGAPNKIYCRLVNID